jgi:hypothetical protein
VVAVAARTEKRVLRLVQLGSAADVVVAAAEHAAAAHGGAVWSVAAGNNDAGIEQAAEWEQAEVAATAAVAAVKEELVSKFEVGERVERRLKGGQWRQAFVTNIDPTNDTFPLHITNVKKPLNATIDELDASGYVRTCAKYGGPWDEIRKLDSTVAWNRAAAAKVVAAVAKPACSIAVCRGSSWLQAGRADGLHFHGLDCLPENNRSSCGGVFTVDTQDPVFSDRPHWSNGAGRGGHLYYDAGAGRWVLSNSFDSQSGNSVATFDTVGAIPTAGKAGWKDQHGKPVGQLAVAELSAAEVAEAARTDTTAAAAGLAKAAAQAERAVGLYLTRFPGHWEQRQKDQLGGIFTVDAEAPSANDRPHWSNGAERGWHLWYHPGTRSWVFNSVFDPEHGDGIATCETAGAMPTVGEAPRGWKDADGKALKGLAMAELSAAEMAEAVQQLLDLFDSKSNEASAVVKLFERVTYTDELLEMVE